MVDSVALLLVSGVALGLVAGVTLLIPAKYQMSDMSMESSTPTFNV